MEIWFSVPSEMLTKVSIASLFLKIYVKNSKQNFILLISEYYLKSPYRFWTAFLWLS